MKKSILFSFFALLLATFGFGGISMAVTTVSDPYGSISYTLNGDSETQYEAKFITIDDGETTITILDRNLGATSNVPNSSDSRGFHFQWGNNYGFSTSTTPASSTTQVSADSITLPYLGNKFIYGEYIYNWLDDNDKVDLWGGSTGDQNIYSALTEEQAQLRQGPCPDNWHVPSAGELSGMIKLMGANKSEMRNKLKIPYVGYRNDHYNTLANDGKTAYWWSSSPVENSSSSQAFYMWYESDDRAPDMTAGSDRADGYSIRCFYNDSSRVESALIISGINLTGPASVYDGDDWLYDWSIYTTDSTYTTGNYMPVEWDGTDWVDTTHKLAHEGDRVGFKITLTPEEWYSFSENPTINYNGEVWTSGYTTFDSGTNTLYIDLGIVSPAPILIEHIVLVGDFLPMVHGAAPTTNITTNTTGITLGEVTWGKGDECTAMATNETFSAYYSDKYCLLIPFTVESGYVLKNYYPVYRKNTNSDRSTDRMYSSDEEYNCTSSLIKITDLRARYEVKVSSLGEIVDTLYREYGCSVGNGCGWGIGYSYYQRPGYILNGYFTDSGFTNQLNRSYSGVTENMTVYVKLLERIPTIELSGITIPVKGVQSTVEGIIKSPIDTITRGTSVWKVATSDEPENEQYVDFDAVFEGGKSYYLYTPFTIAQGYGVDSSTILKANGTPRDMYNVGCNSSWSCTMWLSYTIPFVITFYSDGEVYMTGTAYNEQTINYSYYIWNPYKNGAQFSGWYKDEGLTQPRRLDYDAVTGDMNLYAKWVNQVTNISLTGVVLPAGEATATVAGITLSESSSGVQIGTLKWMQGESDFNGKYASGTEYSLYIPFKLINDYVMPSYYGYVDFYANGNWYSKTISTTEDEQYPYYIKVNFTATAPSTGTTTTTPSAGGSAGGGGGGKTVKKDTTNTDKTTEKEDTDDVPLATENNSDTPIYEQGNQSEVLDNGYTREFNNAYRFGLKYGITTMDDINKADMYGPLTRIAMDKMLVNYAINVLHMVPDTTREVPNFPDVDEKLNEEYGNAVTLGYQLGIMGINIEEFRPFDEVPRSDFGTSLGRMLFGLADGEGLYYEPHLKKLKEKGIITNDDPELKELRGYVMLMLMRSSK